MPVWCKLAYPFLTYNRRCIHIPLIWRINHIHSKRRYLSRTHKRKTNISTQQTLWARERENLKKVRKKKWVYGTWHWWNYTAKNALKLEVVLRLQISNKTQESELAEQCKDYGNRFYGLTLQTGRIFGYETAEARMWNILLTNQVKWWQRNGHT